MRAAIARWIDRHVTCVHHLHERRIYVHPQMPNRYQIQVCSDCGNHRVVRRLS